MRLLVVEDNKELANLLAKGLQSAGYQVDLLASVAEAQAALATTRFGALILDIGLPDGDGLSILRELRRRKDPLPVLVLTARGGVHDRVSGLRSGADDYLVKPFSFAELAARLRALDRRPKPSATELCSDALTLDLIRRTATVRGERLDLTPTEFSLLELLATNAGKPLFIEQIIARVWRSAPSTTADTVRVHMSSLRKKIEPNPSDPRYIITEPWVGYRFIAEPV